MAGVKTRAAPVIQSTQVNTLNKARNVIFILLAGAPSHTDTFDLKVVPGTTPIRSDRTRSTASISRPA